MMSKYLMYLSLGVSGAIGILVLGVVLNKVLFGYTWIMQPLDDYTSHIHCIRLFGLIPMNVAEPKNCSDMPLTNQFNYLRIARYGCEEIEPYTWTCKEPVNKDLFPNREQ